MKTIKQNNQNKTENNLLDVNSNSLNKRRFLKNSLATGLTLMSGGITLTNSMTALGENSKVTIAPPKRLMSKKSWAKTNLRGGESFILPSMSPDFKKIDEEGIRREVRHSIKQGFCSVMPLPIGIDSKTDLLMQDIVADEAKEKIFTVGIIRPGSWKEKKQSIRDMEKKGTSHVLMYFNPDLKNEDAIYHEMKTIIENTSLGIILYAKPSPKIKHLDPTGLPLATFDRLAELDNVVGVKFTQTLRPATAYAVAERLGNRLLLGVVDLEMMLPLSLKYKMQWTGQWGIDSLQSPDTPWVNQFLDLLRQGKNQEANDLYWRYETIASHFFKLQAPSLSIGGHPWLHIKYMKWLTGGNGGLLADLNATNEYVPHLDAKGRKKCREAFQRVEIKTTNLPDDAFVVGNAAYEKGVRPKDLPAMPQYIS
ncbi:MAG: dihydrodipicolinate synthase family protein [Cellvibrionaceae bacterium]